MPMSVGSSTTNNDLHIYSVPFSDDKYVWGRDIDGLHLDEYLAGYNYVRRNRYNRKLSVIG